MGNSSSQQEEALPTPEEFVIPTDIPTPAEESPAPTEEAKKLQHLQQKPQEVLLQLIKQPDSTEQILRYLCKMEAEKKELQELSQMC